MGVCNCSMFCCALLYVHSSIAIILLGKRELIALSSWCLVMVERLFLAVPRGCQQFVIVVFPDHTHLLFLKYCQQYVQSRLLEFVFLVSKLNYHPLNEMVIKPLLYILCLSLILAGQLSIYGRYL